MRVLGVGLGLVILVWVGLAVFLGDNPKEGDCLSSLDENWLASLDVVECDSSEASYEVVAYDESGSTAVCQGHENGEVYQDTGRRGRVYWSLCAEPT